MRAIKYQLRLIEDIITQNKIECPFVAVLNWPEYIVLHEDHIDEDSYINWCYPLHKGELREKSLETLPDFTIKSIIFILEYKEGKQYHAVNAQWVRLKTDVFLYSVKLC